MQVFIGLVSKGSKKARELLEEGWGVVLVPQLLYKFCPQTFSLYFLDNGAFSYWKNGRAFDGRAFLKTLERVAEFESSPKFVVVPDLVAQGLKSLEFSLNWLERLKREYPQFSYALALQDGMTVNEVEPVMDNFDYLFVGGTLRWKVQTGRLWVNLARKHGKKCHVGRVGTVRRVRWAKAVGADSIDSALPLFSKEKWERFRRALREPSMMELPF